jgi:hypothetical protein
MTMWTVSIDEPTITRSVRAILGSLLDDYSWTPARRADVIAVDGSRDDWPARAHRALGRASRGVVVVEPTVCALEPFDELVDSTRQAGRTVLLAEGIAGHAALEHATLPQLHGTSFVELVGTGFAIAAEGRAHDLAFCQVRLLQELGLREVTVSSLTDVGPAVAATVRGTISSSPAVIDLLATIASGAPGRYELHLTGGAEALHVRLPAPDTASPALVQYTDSSGSHQAPALYETGHRTAWKQLLVQPHTSAPRRLDRFRDALALFQPHLTQAVEESFQ